MRHCRSSGGENMRERAEWLMFCSLCRTRCLLLSRSTRKQTFCLFWVRKPHGGKEAEQAWPFSGPGLITNQSDLGLSPASLEQGTYRLQTRAHEGNTVGGRCHKWNVSIFWCIYFRRTHLYSKDTMTESQWQLAVMKCLALLPHRGCEYWEDRSTFFFNHKSVSFFIYLFFLINSQFKMAQCKFWMSLHHQGQAQSPWC